LKGGKIPVEILVTTKDAEEKAKVFEKCLEVIKTSGVRFSPFRQKAQMLTFRRTKSEFYQETQLRAHLWKTGSALMPRYLARWKK
jgi:hypothetical protein